MTEACDLPPAVEADAEQWKRATSFAELCELAATFMEGTIGYFPGWFSSTVYPETESIRKELAEINRRGLLTYMSQPGKPLSLDLARGQRAFLTGIMEGWKAENLRSLLQPTGFYIAVFAFTRPMETRFAAFVADLSRILVTLKEGEDGFDVGDDRYDVLVGFERCLPKCSDAMYVVGIASFVVIIDHEWGRNTLFENLISTLASIPEPTVVNE